jgi:hypothetical protein
MFAVEQQVTTTTMERKPSTATEPSDGQGTLWRSDTTSARLAREAQRLFMVAENLSTDEMKEQFRDIARHYVALAVQAAKSERSSPSH